MVCLNVLSLTFEMHMDTACSHSVAIRRIKDSDRRGWANHWVVDPGNTPNHMFVVQRYGCNCRMELGGLTSQWPGSCDGGIGVHRLC